MVFQLNWIEHLITNQEVNGFESLRDHMAKIDKKRKRLQERIEFLENEMKTNLKQKTSNTAEISVGDYMSKIQALNKELSELK